jgi:hypothetical protein
MGFQEVARAADSIIRVTHDAVGAAAAGASLSSKPGAQPAAWPPLAGAAGTLVADAGTHAAGAGRKVTAARIAAVAAGATCQRCQDHR